MKKKGIILLLSVWMMLPVIAQDLVMNTFINDLMGKMTIEEKIGQLNLTNGGDFTTGSTATSDLKQKIRNGQVGSILNTFSVASMRAAQDLAVKESRNHIPILFGLDVIHGYKTIFPIPLAMSCSWDPEMIEKGARIAAVEATSNGVAWTYSPMVDIARDARWGRIAEGSGEDPWLGSVIAKAMVKGYQGDDLSQSNTMMACVKHFALYGAAEGGRDYNTVDMSRITMYNEYLPPSKAAIDAGAGSIMTSFNVIDAVPATGNQWLLTDLLRNQWKFDGFVVTDYTAINEMIVHGMGNLQDASALALKAGTDMDMVGEGFLSTLKKSLDEGRISLQDIDLACKRVLEAKYKLGLFEDPYRYLNEERSKSSVLTPEHLSLTRQLAARSIVLLKNDKQILPLKKSGTIAVIGPLADNKADILGTWTMAGDASRSVTVKEGLQNAGSSIKILYAKGSPATDIPGMIGGENPLAVKDIQKDRDAGKSAEVLLNEALQIASKADVIVAVLGEKAGWSGEAASMADISLQKPQQELLKALIATGKPVVLVLINGRPMTLPWESVNVHAIVEAWAGGTEAGNAIADVLFGDYNPSGKLTTSFPFNVGQIPLYYNHKNTGRPAQAENKFSSKYLDSPIEPLYPFGYGLSYTTFAYSDITLNKTMLKGNDKLMVRVTISNTGNIAGEEVVQLYIRDHVASISRPVKELKNFIKIMLQPGEKKEITMEITPDDLKFYNSSLQYDWEPGDFTVFVGTNSKDVKSAGFNWVK